MASPKMELIAGAIVQPQLAGLLGAAVDEINADEDASRGLAVSSTAGCHRSAGTVASGNNQARILLQIDCQAGVGP